MKVIRRLGALAGEDVSVVQLKVTVGTMERV